MKSKKTQVRFRQMTDELLAAELERYEKKFGMSSEDFFERYQRGEMGDSEDVMRWAAYYHMSLVPAGEGAKVKP